MVPTSAKPNPSASILSYTSAFLSNPAAKPIGFENFFPNTLIFKISSSFEEKIGIYMFFKN